MSAGGGHLGLQCDVCSQDSLGLEVVHLGKVNVSPPFYRQFLWSAFIRSSSFLVVLLLLLLYFDSREQNLA